LHVHVGSIDVPNAQATANFTNGNIGNGVLYKRGAGTLALPNARQSFLKVYEGNVRINPNAPQRERARSIRCGFTPARAWIDRQRPGHIHH
jgi:hypothetical protein